MTSSNVSARPGLTPVGLDIEDSDGLRQYLVRRTHGQAPVDISKLTGGVSNRTVLVTWPNGDGWVLKQALSKLRVQADWFSSPKRIQVESRALQWLNRVIPGSTPEFVFDDPANYLLAMRAVPSGHENWKSILMAGRIDMDHVKQFGRLVGTIHRRSAECSATCVAFEDTSFFQTLRLEPYYIYTATTLPAAVGFLEGLARETLTYKLSLVHGDLSPKNTLVFKGKLILLDYEVMHLGDPAFDLGFALTHFLSKAHHLPDHRAQFAQAAKLFWQTYFDQVTILRWDSLESRTARHTLACLLARVAGKSPLEYLNGEESARQRNAVLQLIQQPPVSVPELIDQFLQRVSRAENR